jgi:hypothetical protein
VPSSSRWAKSGTAALLTAATVLVVAVTAFACGGGSDGQGSGTPPGPDNTAVLTVDQALASKAGQDLKISGYVVSAGGRTVLASALAESYPPQAAGATIPLSGLDLASLVGLSTTVGQAGLTEATWSDYPLVLEGLMVSGAFEVRAAPPIEEDTFDVLRLRFSAVSGPVNSGSLVWWAMDVTNTGQVPVELSFSDSQRGDIILDQGDTDVYTWSADKAFAQTVETVTLQPGKSFSVVLNDTLTVPPGAYNVTARLTAKVGPADTAEPLPDLVSTVVVH